MRDVMTKHVLLAALLVWVSGSLGLERSFPAGPLTATLLAQQPAPVDEFVPIDQLPPQDQLPAAPLLVAAYAFVVLGLFAYLVSVARRLGGVQKDLERLQSEIKRTGRT
jgi:CcmD family protein